jgi:polysaccharide biosynthesis protein PslG
MRWILTALGLAAAGGAAAAFLLLPRGDAEAPTVPAVLPQSPMPGRLLVGFQDDASLRWAEDRATSLDRARDAHAVVIRTTVAWHSAAPERPANPTDPFDPAYKLEDVDDLARNAQQRGIELLLTIWGTPEWANGGEKPNSPPTDPADLQYFAQALADRYSGRHAGYPAVRLFSAWNEPNLEQFLAPQFDENGRSVGPSLYAPIARAIYAGVKEANPEALVAVGETSPRGRDLPSAGTVQDSHSPPRFARLLSEQQPRIEFDAWAQHPYPPRPAVAPSQPVRWPRVGIENLERFGESLDAQFGREQTPIWITEYGHETLPLDPLGIPQELQAQYAEEALALAAENPRIRTFVWFIVRDRSDTPWQSGVLEEDGSPKPVLETFTAAASELDARNPVLPADADTARIPALELAYSTAAGDPIAVAIGGSESVSVPLREDGWIEVPLENRTGSVLEVQATNPHGQAVQRVVELRRGGLDAELTQK